MLLPYGRKLELRKLISYHRGQFKLVEVWNGKPVEVLANIRQIRMNKSAVIRVIHGRFFKAA